MPVDLLNVENRFSKKNCIFIVSWTGPPGCATMLTHLFILNIRIFKLLFGKELPLVNRRGSNIPSFLTWNAVGCFLTFPLNISLFCHNLCCCFSPPSFLFFFFFWGIVEEGCLAVAEGGPPSSIKESEVKFFLVCFYLSGYSSMLEIFVFYCIFFSL